MVMEASAEWGSDPYFLGASTIFLTAISGRLNSHQLDHQLHPASLRIPAQSVKRRRMVFLTQTCLDACNHWL